MFVIPTTHLIGTFWIKYLVLWVIVSFPTKLTGERPNVTLCYKLRRTFFTPKFNQIPPKVPFSTVFGFQNSQIVLGITQLKINILMFFPAKNILGRLKNVNNVMLVC